MRHIGRLLEWADTILGWLERTSWGTKMISVLFGSAFSLWVKLTTEFAAVTIALYGMAMLMIVLVIQELTVPKMRKFLSPPIRVEISLSARGQNTKTGDANVQCIVHVVNTSKSNRVSMDFSIRIEFHDPTRKYRSYGNMSVKNEGVRVDLGPQEHTEGSLETHWRKPDFNLLEEANTCYLDIRDRVSLRRMHVPIVGPTTKPPASQKETFEQKPSS